MPIECDKCGRQIKQNQHTDNKMLTDGERHICINHVIDEVIKNED